MLVSTEENAGFVTVTEHDLSVVLDTNLTPELIEEGFVREIVSKVQTMRKDIGLEVTDHIILTITAQGELLEAAKEGADMISSGAQADAVLFAQPCDNANQWEINGEHCTLSIKKA